MSTCDPRSKNFQLQYRVSVQNVLEQRAHLLLKPGDGRMLDAVAAFHSVLACFAVSKDKHLI